MTALLSGIAPPLRGRGPALASRRGGSATRRVQIGLRHPPDIVVVEEAVGAERSFDLADGIEAVGGRDPKNRVGLDSSAVSRTTRASATAVWSLGRRSPRTMRDTVDTLTLERWASWRRGIGSGTGCSCVEHLDIWYVDHWSLLLEIRILAMTAIQVLRRPDVSTTEDLALGFPLPGVDVGPRGEPGVAGPPIDDEAQ